MVSLFNKRPVVLFLLLLLLYCAGWEGYGQSYNFQHYTVDDGLAKNSIQAICDDEFGNIWFATQGGGLSRFDGINFENFTIRDGLASNFVRDVTGDDAGNIWAATSSGLSRLNGDTIINFIISEDVTANNSVNKILKSADGVIWFSPASGGLSYIEKGAIVELEGIPANLPFVDMKEDRNGMIWGVTSTSRIYKINLKDKSTSLVYDRKGTGHFILSLFINSRGVIWVCTNDGLFVLNRRTFEVEEPLAPLRGNFVKSVLEDDQGNKWMVSTFGLLSYGGGFMVKSYSSAEGFTNEMVNAIFKDREGLLWFGTNGDGVFKFAGDTFLNFNKNHGLSHSEVTSVIRDDNGGYWFSTYGEGVDYYDGVSFKNFSDKEGFEGKYITCSTKDIYGNLWFGTRSEGVIMYDGKEFKKLKEKDGLVNNIIRCIYGDKSGNLWVGTVSGLSRYDGHSFENFGVDQGLKGRSVWQLYERDSGKVIIVTREGVSVYEEERLGNFALPEDIFNKRINIIRIHPSGDIWVGFSGHGVARVPLEANNGLLTYYTTDDGLSSDIIHSIIVDQKGDLVVGTDRGVDKLFLHGGRNVMAIKSYRGTNGHPGLKTSHNACYMEESGDIWFGSTSGIFKYQVEKEVISQKTPITYISKVRLFYDDVNWKEYTDKLEHWTGVPENLVLKYSENNLVFEYFGNSLQFPAAVRYQYKLEHFDENWSPVTNLTQAKYTNLPPGNYTFLVKSSNSDRAWNEVPARFNFEISPPFWRLPLFYIIFGSLALLIIKVIYDYRLKVKVNKLMELEKVRAAEQLKIRKIMASDFHDNMGNELASITVFTNLISLKLKNKSIEVDGLLKNIEKHTRSLFNGTKDFIWSMDPANDDLSEIYMYLKDFGEELYDKTKIKFYTDFDGEEKSSRKLCPGSGRQIVLIFKEVMTNTLKHSKATACHYILNFSDESFVFTFKDNGKGLPTNAGHNNKGYGLRNIKSRAAKGKFILDIESQGKGVSIKLKGSLQSGT